MSVKTCPEVRDKTANEVRNGIVSFIKLLDENELLTGTPTVSASAVTSTSSSPSALSFSNAAVVSTTKTLEDGTTVLSGQAVQFSVSGGTATTKYKITVQCGTDSTPAETLEQYATLWVRDS